jgi:glycosyltransferase involved in cell wall biosynthesis
MNGHHPSVTVVIATRNRPELLRRAIDAVVAQRYDGTIEVVVVFDRSEPEHELESDAPLRRVRVTTNARTPGLPGGRNTGICVSRSELVAFCDDDDEWLPDKLAVQVDHLTRHGGCGFVTTGIRISFEGTFHDRPSPTDVLTTAALVHDRTTEAHPSTFLMHRTLLDRIGLVDEEIPGGYSEDYDLLLRAARATEVRCVREPLVVVRWHQSSYFADRWSTIVDAQRYLMAHHPEFAAHRRAEARLRAQVAFALAALGRRGDAVREIGAVVARWPFEKRWPVAAFVALGIVSPDRALRWAHRAGRGI